MTDLICPRCGRDLDADGEVKATGEQWVCGDCYEDLQPQQPGGLR